MYLLSIIIPVYNAAQWLEECLQSILTSLSETSAAEIILVDDGSTDESALLCDAYAKKYPHIRSIHQPNGGVAAARNAGLALAAGQYLAWVDPDDLVSGDWFSSIREAIGQGEPDVVVMDTLRFGEGIERCEVYGRPGGFVDRDQFMEDLYRDIRMLSGLPNKVMKAELFSGLRFDTTLSILEDFAAMPQILSHAETVYYIPKCLYHYRQHGGSLLHHVTAERAFLSFRIAVKRAEEAPPRFRPAAETAAVLQALAFCQNRYLHEDFGAETGQLQTCTNYVRKKLPALCIDPEIPLRTKVKLALLCTGLLRFVQKKGRS